MRIETRHWDMAWIATRFPYICVFMFLLGCNLLTPFFVDDFAYHYSFETGERIQSIADIVPSICAHAKSMNGRLVAHFLVQLSMILPAWIFDIINAGMFTIELWLIVRLSGAEGWQSAVVCLFSFFAIWVYIPVFGQVNLWQDGSINYLWSVVLALAYVGLFAREYLPGKDPFPKKKILFLFAFAVGAYSEAASAAAIFMSAVLLLLKAIENKKLPEKYFVGLLITACLGYVTIYLAPAQWANKYAGSGGIIQSTKIAVQRYSEFQMLLTAFPILLVYNLSARTNRKRIVLACTFLMGSLLANFMMIFASAYPYRASCSTCVFLVCAVAVLLQPMLSLRKQPLILGVTVLFLLFGMTKVPTGMLDIYRTYRRVQANKVLIAEKKAEGELDIILPYVGCGTKYSGVYGLRYLDLDDAATWPNDSMANYYGVHSILGTLADEN